SEKWEVRGVKPGFETSTLPSHLSLLTSHFSPPRDVVARALSHPLDLPHKFRERGVVGFGVELRGVDHQQRSRGVVEEVVLIRLVQFADVVLVYWRDLGL